MRKKTLMLLPLGAAIWCAAPHAMAGDKGPNNNGDKTQGKDGKWEDKRTEAERLLAAFTEHLKLTPVQQDKIKPILTDMFEQMKAAKQDRTVLEGQRGEKAMAIRKTALDKVAAELAVEQKAIFDKHRAGIESGAQKDRPKDGGDKPRKEGGDRPNKEGNYKDGQKDAKQ